MAQVDINLKNLVIILGLLGGLIGNVFFVGKLYNEFELLKDNVDTIQENQNVIQLKQEILELNYKIKSLRLEIDGDYRE
tara:strand:+ start:41 stop:277 length:237 start_codon:yes stop_codon:yes gene_type:complete